MTLDQITKLATAYNLAETNLHEVLTLFNKDLTDVKDSYKKELGAALRRAKRAQAELVDAIAQSTELFANPKSRILDGIKVGLRKSADGVEVTNEEATIELIRKHLPEDLAKILIGTKETITKSALKKLTKEQLALIGAEPVTGQDSIICEPVDGDVEKLIAQLMKAAKQETIEEADAA